MITVIQIANIIQNLYNNIDKDSTDVSITINTELKKFYGSYGTLPSNIIANIQEIASTPIGVDGIESYQSAYSIEMLVPENYIEANKHIWKSLQMEYQGKLVEMPTELQGYNLKLSFESYNESNYTTRSNGNTKVVSIVVRANVDSAIANGSSHTFSLVVNNTEYSLPFTRFEFGESKNLRAGNFSSNGRIGAIVQSQNFSCTLYCVLREDNFWKNVVLPILLDFTGYEATLKIDIAGTSYPGTNAKSIPVVINILNYRGNATDGIICAINCIYRG